MLNAINGSTGVANINYSQALTPDALMVYCQTRLRGIDDQVNDKFAKQQKTRDITNAVTNLQNKISEAAAMNTGNGDGILEKDRAIRDEIVAAYDKAIVATEGTPQRDALIKERQAFLGDAGNGAADKQHVQDGGGDGCMERSKLTAMADRIGQVSKEMSSSAELDMIQLQSLMSQRQTAIQICTNLISSLGETSKAIAQKIGS